MWRTKPPDAESAVGAAIPKVRRNARTCPVHAVLGSFCKTVLNLNLAIKTVAARCLGRSLLLENESHFYLVLYFATNLIRKF